MAKTFKIPVGNISSEQLTDALGILTEKAAEQVKSNWSDARLTSENVQTQYEATEKREEVLLKFFHNRILLRNGFLSGANVDVIWRRADPENVSLKIDTCSTFEDYLFSGTFVIAAMLAFIT